MRQFRVVVIDDDLNVIRRLPGRVDPRRRHFEGETWQIDLASVHVELERDLADRYCFTDATLERLVQAFSVPADLILGDYGYVNADALAAWQSKHAQGHSITSYDIDGRLLTPVELVAFVRDVTTKGNLDSAVRRNLRMRFLEYSGPLILYTLATDTLVMALGEVEARRARVEPAFPKAEVAAIDTKYELYNRGEFASEKHGHDFYAHLVTGLLNNAIQSQLLLKMLDDARRLKYLRARRSIAAVGTIVALGGGVAAVAEFIGSQFADFLRAGDYLNAGISAFLGIVMVFIIGVSLPFAFGAFMSGLVRATADHEAE